MEYDKLIYRYFNRIYYFNGAKVVKFGHVGVV